MTDLSDLCEAELILQQGQCINPDLESFLQQLGSDGVAGSLLDPVASGKELLAPREWCSVGYPHSFYREHTPAITGNTDPSPWGCAELLLPRSWRGELQCFLVSAVGSSTWCSLCPCCDLQPPPLTLLPALTPLVPSGPLPCPL